jgi:hypothetical protein
VLSCAIGFEGAISGFAAAVFLARGFTAFLVDFLAPGFAFFFGGDFLESLRIFWASDWEKTLLLPIFFPSFCRDAYTRSVGTESFVNFESCSIVILLPPRLSMKGRLEA